VNERKSGKFKNNLGFQNAASYLHPFQSTQTNFFPEITIGYTKMISKQQAT
jgi:hypothetical protein